MNIFQNGGTPIKAWTDGVELEDEAKQQLTNISLMPFIYKHIAVMPDVHCGKGATVGSVIPTKGAIIPAAVGVDIGCFRGDTRIPLLGGTQKTLKELHKLDKPFWIYSIDKNLNIVPGKAIAIQTRKKMPLMKITISGGDEIVCTPDHLFMLKDGTYLEAQQLKFNQSLMPLYRRWETRDGYEVINNGKGTSRKTHVLVYEALNSKLSKGYVVHHKNHNHFDNRPENLELMTVGKHSKYHRNNGNIFNNADAIFQEKRRRGIKESMLKPERIAQCKEVGTKNITKYMKENPDHFRSSIIDNGKRGAVYLEKFNVSSCACSDCGHIFKNPATLQWHKKKDHNYNHKIIAMEFLNEKEDVYCLQVETHHNFALSAGIFVHNCGMAAVRTTLSARDLPDNLFNLRCAIEKAVPHGRTDNGGMNDRGAWGDQIPTLVSDNFKTLRVDLAMIALKHPLIEKPAKRAARQLGTLGTGNHFIEICLDENDQVWIMLHSGSRGIGNSIGNYFIELAKKDMQRWFINLPDKDLSYFPEGSDHFDEYLNAVGWAQNYASVNRNCMMLRVIEAIKTEITKPFAITNEAINCHHNYVEKERHFGSNIWVTRKGAVRAREGDLGIIPGSMGAKSFIVRGKGNKESFDSCSHGAGRKMSRTKAKSIYTIEDHIKATEGVECRKDIDVIDETPMAYKNIDAVMNAQSDLIEIVHTIKQIVCVKG